MSLDTLLSSTAATTDPDPAVLASARARLDDRTRTAQSVVLLHRRRARRRRLGLSLAGVAAAGALALVPLAMGGTTPEAEAAEVLVTAGAAAAAQPDEVGDAPFWRTVATYAQEGNGQDGTEHRREIWNARVEPGLLLDEAVDADPIGLGAAVFAVGGTTVDWDGLTALPTDPVALRSALLDGVPGSSRTEEDVLFTQITDLLVESPASPALRGALWQVASQIGGVRLVGDVTDAAGRPGVALELELTDGDGTEVRRLVVDPDAGTLLERVEVYDGPGTASDTRYRSTYLEQGPADTLPVQPQLRPGCTSFDRC
jgi:hypothetical protein